MDLLRILETLVEVFTLIGVIYTVADIRCKRKLESKKPVWEITLKDNHPSNNGFTSPSGKYLYRKGRPVAITEEEKRYIKDVYPNYFKFKRINRFWQFWKK